MKHFALFFKYDTCKLSKKNPKGISHIYIYIYIFIYLFILFIYIFIIFFLGGGVARRAARGEVASRVGFVPFKPIQDLFLANPSLLASPNPKP